MVRTFPEIKRAQALVYKNYNKIVDEFKDKIVLDELKLAFLTEMF